MAGRTLAHVNTAGPADVPAAFLSALRSLRETRVRPEVQLTEVPGPGRVAPFSAALTADVRPPRSLDDEDLASGRFVVLHDPAGQEAWEGTFRIVTLTRATLEPELGADALLGEVAWSWWRDAVDGLGLEVRAPGGTVTRVLSQSFGALADRPDEVEVEIRASWTAADAVLGPHLLAWTSFLCTCAGLPPLPDGVTPLAPRH